VTLHYVLVLDCAIRCSKKRKSYALTLKLETDEPDGSNRRLVSNTSRVSNRSREFDGIVLLQAGGFYQRKYGKYTVNRLELGVIQQDFLITDVCSVLLSVTWYRPILDRSRNTA